MVDTSNLLPSTPRFLKVPLIGLNLILWILGLVLIIIGGVATSFLSNFKDFTNASNAKSALSNLTTSVPAGVIVIGIFFFLLTLAGCYVAYKEKLVGLVIYCVLMLVLLVILIGISGKALTLHNDDVLPTVGDNWIIISNKNDEKSIKVINGLEKFLECCNWNATDTTDKNVFCPPKYVNMTVDSNYPYCENKLGDQLSSKLYMVGATGVAIGIIELVAVLFALFLIVRICRSPRPKQYDSNY
ncbi:hypothetical protein DICPUDRAFT_93791 [Dictyostelium purpureum]|uniref:Tetraspanin n=1 Tax=Dictyostelium purpureum TaxID=5786 RepID=F0ZBP6_DICPU|nr:uncharacterized protein DICPUDRAFT_93791 [Dictyostelium purpureum]EGC38634.1 hypothetical protein DICPUDRAFT_93791 [Dictyostelium purpureum]|eukprot:XP_003284827.1 hypothetical protein DICPUDRAFT_93791 [Dictyostelium purpureum]